MPDMRTRRAREFSKYVHMETEELQRILREDASTSRGRRSGTKAARYAMEALSMRRNAQVPGNSPVEALDTFYSEYQTPENLPFSLALAAPGGRGQGKEMPCRNLAVIAAVILLFAAACSITAQAMGFRLWDHMAGWAQETSPAEPSKSIPCPKLQAALDAHGITLPLVPSYLPERFTEGDLIVNEEGSLSFDARYFCGDAAIFISIVEFPPHATMNFYKDSVPVESYTVHGVTYYIFSNNGWMVAGWTKEPYACYITGEISSQELKKIINSIEKG